MVQMVRQKAAISPIVNLDQDADPAAGVKRPHSAADCTAFGVLPAQPVWASPIRAETVA
jgi:hypothetical protein